MDEFETVGSESVRVGNDEAMGSEGHTQLQDLLEMEVAGGVAKGGGSTVVGHGSGSEKDGVWGGEVDLDSSGVWCVCVFVCE